MSFEPVFLPPEAALGDRASMTFLRLYNQCPRSGFLYAKHRRTEAQTVEMVRGSALHAFCERATSEMLEHGESSIPPELAKALLGDVLNEMHVPLEEHDYLREMAFRWANEWRLRDDERTVAVERLFVLELEGWQVRCKVDYASADAEGRLYVADYKSGRGAPSYERLARKRPDADWADAPARRLAAKSFQLVVYVMALAFGRPVCDMCDGEGSVRYMPNGSTDPQDEAEGRCSCADGLGEPVVKGCPEAIAEYVYPGIEDSEGRMLRRTVGLTRLEMLEYRESLEAVLRRLNRSIETGDWPAIVSDEACSECPAESECPIPRELRSLAGEINSLEDAREALVRRHRSQARDRAVGREVRKFMEQQLGGAPIFYGDRVAELVPRETTEVRDREELMAAIAGGMPVEEARSRFIRVSRGTKFNERDLEPDEIGGE
jgi:hypothetical protein